MEKSRSEDTSWTIAGKAAYDKKRESNKMSRKSSAIFWLVIGLLFLGYAVAVDAPYLSGAGERYESTSGTITGLDHGRRGKCIVHLDYTVNEKQYSTIQTARREACDNTIGKHMTLRYDPQDIQGTITDNTENGSLLIAWTRLSAGTLTVAISALVLRSAVRSKKATEK